MTIVDATLPDSLVDNTRLADWFDLSQDRTLVVLSGKVELGQGLMFALRLIAAEELDLGVGQVRVVSGDTGCSPYEWFTAGSRSIEVAGAAVRLASAELRARLFAAACVRLRVPGEALRARDGMFLLDDADASLSYWDIACELDMTATIDGRTRPREAADYRLIGQDIAPDDFRAKVFGTPYIHDFALPGMRHGRVLRKPSRTAELVALAEARTRAMAGVLHVVRDRDFVGVVAENEYAAVTAVERLEKDAQWRDPLDEAQRAVSPVDYFERLPSTATVLADGVAPFETEGDAVSAVYTRQLLAHGSVGPSCAVAAWNGAGIQVWTQSQGVFALRDQIARVTGVAVQQIRVQHLPGAGCYGHTGADDVVLDAVLLSRAAGGAPVRALWRRVDELRHEPLGSPMKVRIAATLGNDGRIDKWQLDTWSGAFAQRPGWNGGVNLHAAADGSGRWPFAQAKDLPAHNGGSKNAVAGYDFVQTATHHMVQGLPFRLSALRSLGAFANVFAIESFMDELAQHAQADPLEFRLRHLSDPRAVRVIEAAAGLADWAGAQRAGRSLGIGYAQFKNSGAYCAVVAEVSAEDDVRLVHMWAAVDAGLAIVPDSVRAQVEGGMLQAASWMLHEALSTEGPRVVAETWSDYPVLGFAEVPLIEVQVIPDAAHPSLGVGEVSLGPAAGAIGNAVAAALGLHLRNLPLTRDRIRAALLAM